MADITVQRGQATIPSSASTVTLTAGADYAAPSAVSKAFVRITATRPVGLPSSGLTLSASSFAATVYDSNIGTSIVFERGAADASNPCIIDWELIEYTGASGGPHEFIVRGRGLSAFASSDNAVTSSAITGVVSDAKVLPWLTGYSAASDTGAQTMRNFNVRTEWDSAGDTVTLRRDRSENIAVTVSWAAVEYTGAAWSVQSADAALVTGTSTTTITSVGDVSRAFLHTQCYAGTEPALDDLSAVAYLSAPDTITYVTESTFSGTLEVRAWVLANSQTGIGAMSVQRFSGTLTTQDGTFMLTTSAVVLADASVVEMTARNSLTSGSPPRDVISWRLTGTTTLTGRQRDGAGNSAYRVALVMWPTAPSSTPLRPWFF